LANAEKFFRVSLSKNPLYAPSLYNMALVYYNKKDHQMTIQYAKKAIEADPGNSQYDNMVGLGYYGLKDWVNAERAYREALRKNPAFQDALFNLAGSLYMQARYREARDAYSGVLKLRPDYPGAEKWMKMSEDLMKGE
jgi:tetratricopeptide (TPR) repeat protein